MKRAVFTSLLPLVIVAAAQTTVMSAVNLQHVLNATAGEARGFAAETAFTRISIDSRTTQPGDLFWAIRGERHDGHDYIGDALARGAAGVVVEKEKCEPCLGPAIIVPETLSALQNFAAAHRAKSDAAVIGVTGSFGKTTTRELIFSVLAAGHSGTRSPWNYNNHVGVPLSLLDIDDGHEFAVIEMGASACGEIRDLCELAAPEIGVITGIGPAHLDGFGDLNGVISAKSELLQSLPSGGFAVLNGDDPAVRQMARHAACPVIFVGEQEHNDVKVHRIEHALSSSGSGHSVRFRVADDSYELPVLGRHHVQLASTAIVIGREIGLSPAIIAEGLANFQPIPGRCRWERLGDWHVIDDSYNANPASMKAACALLRDWPGSGRRILVAGDMRELGTETITAHIDAGRYAAESEIDHVIAHGDFARHLVGGACEAGMDAGRLADCESLAAVFTVLDCWLEPGDVVLVKGSRSMRMERVVEWIRQQTEHQLSPAQKACA